MDLKKWGSPILSVVGITFLLELPAIALPFRETASSFENYTNALWRQGGSSTVKLYGSLESNNPQDRRLYHGFYGCERDQSPGEWSEIGNGYLNARYGWERYVSDNFYCKGYVDRTTPTGSRRCPTIIRYTDRTRWVQDNANSSPYVASASKTLAEDSTCWIPWNSLLDQFCVTIPIFGCLPCHNLVY